MSKDLLLQIDERATSLGLNRSQYFAHLARKDLAAGGDLVIQELTMTRLRELEMSSPEAVSSQPTRVGRQAGKFVKSLAKPRADHQSTQGRHKSKPPISSSHAQKPPAPEAT